MYAVPLINKNDEIVRTQITLTEVLRDLIEKQGQATGESISAYLRRAALTQLILDSQTNINLKDLANKVIGSINPKKHPEWASKEKVAKWQKKIRSEWTA